MVVTLDNGDVWEQSAPATSQLNLRSGDVVQLDRELGRVVPLEPLRRQPPGQIATALIMWRYGGRARCGDQCPVCGACLRATEDRTGRAGDDSLTWHGITLYGVIDAGFQYDTHSAPFTPYRPAATSSVRMTMSRPSE